MKVLHSCLNFQQEKTKKHFDFRFLTRQEHCQFSLHCGLKKIYKEKIRPQRYYSSFLNLIPPLSPTSSSFPSPSSGETFSGSPKHTTTLVKALGRKQEHSFRTVKWYEGTTQLRTNLYDSTSKVRIYHTWHESDRNDLTAKWETL